MRLCLTRRECGITLLETEVVNMDSKRTKCKASKARKEQAAIKAAVAVREAIAANLAALARAA